MRRQIAARYIYKIDYLGEVTFILNTGVAERSIKPVGVAMDNFTKKVGKRCCRGWFRLITFHQCFMKSAPGFKIYNGVSEIRSERNYVHIRMRNTA